MRPDDAARDLDRLEHMLAAARSASRFVRGRTRADLESDEMLRRALVNALQEIGEAASRVSEAGRERLPGLPWRDVVAMRNVLVHVYWGVDLDVLWRTAVEDAPALIALVEPAVRGRLSQ